MARVAVLILNWNGLDLLKEFLPRVLDNTDLDLADVIVADNGSTDGSVEYLRWLGVETLLFPENYGFAEGYNRAIAQIQHPYCVLLNSDVAPRAGWVNTLTEFMDAHPEVGACQPKVLSWHHPERFEYAGACGGYLDRHGYPYCRGRIFSTIEEDRGQYDAPAEVDWVSGAAMMVRTEAYRAAGGLDPMFFAHMEEIDLCWRLRLKGWTLMAVPQAEVMHLGGGSLPMGHPRKTYLNFRNNLLMLRKNLPLGSQRMLITRRLLDTLAWAKAVATFHWRDAAAIVRAHRHYARMARELPPPSPTAPNLLSGRPNILTQYYLLRHPRFSTIK